MSLKNLMQSQLEDILKVGGALELSATGMAHRNLFDLAICAKKGGSHLTITQASTMAAANLTEIARAGSGHVTFKD